MKIYISGKITGRDLEEARKQFDKAEQYWISQGIEVVNPMKEVPAEDGKPWDYYMRRDIKLLMDCDAIYMMDGWKTSRGAKIEKYIAEQLGMKLYIG